MSAEEIFNKLGYKKDTYFEESFITYIKEKTHSMEDDFVELKWEIIFFKDKREPEPICFHFYVDGNQIPEFSISVKEIEAIQQQIKELGW